MKKCKLCGKGSIMRGKRNKFRGNYNPAPKSRKYPNLQKIILSDGKSVLACTDCIRKTSKTTK